MFLEDSQGLHVDCAMNHGQAKSRRQPSLDSTSCLFAGLHYLVETNETSLKTYCQKARCNHVKIFPTLFKILV